MVTPTIQANLDLLYCMHDLDFTLETALLDDFSGEVAAADALVGDGLH